MTDHIDISPEAVAKLLDGVTPGRAVQFHPKYCAEAKEAPFHQWDSSHDVSVIRHDGARYKVATFRHANDAAFYQSARQLVPALSARVAELEARSLLDGKAMTETAMARDRAMTNLEHWRHEVGKLHSKVDRISAERDRLAAENAAMRDLLCSWVSIAENCAIETGICCCGDNMEHHSEPMACGHVATDHGGYVAETTLKETRAALASSQPRKTDKDATP